MKPYYQNEQVTIYNGDAIDILPALNVRVDLVLTDPPYGVTYQSNAGVGQRTTPITNDGTRLSLALYRAVVPLLRTNHVLWFTRWDAWPDVWTVLGQVWPIRGLLVWDKGTPGMGDLTHWGNSYELIASAGSGTINGKRDSSILRFTGVPSGSRIHPTEKPLELLAYLIQKIKPATVLDPFAGSGATLVAAQQSGCEAIGIEVKESYCEAIAKRIEAELLQPALISACDLEPQSTPITPSMFRCAGEGE